MNNLKRCGLNAIKTTKLSRKEKQRQRQGQNTDNGRMTKMLSSVPKKSISCRSKSTYLSKVECQPIFGFLNHVSSPFFSKTHFFLSHSRFCDRCRSFFFTNITPSLTHMTHRKPYFNLTFSHKEISVK